MCKRRYVEMRNKKTILTTTIVLLIVAMLAGCNSAAKNPKKTLLKLYENMFKSKSLTQEINFSVASDKQLVNAYFDFMYNIKQRAMLIEVKNYPEEVFGGAFSYYSVPEDFSVLLVEDGVVAESDYFEDPIFMSFDTIKRQLDIDIDDILDDKDFYKTIVDLSIANNRHFIKQIDEKHITYLGKVKTRHDGKKVKLHAINIKMDFDDFVDNFVDYLEVLLEDDEFWEELADLAKKFGDDKEITVKNYRTEIEREYEDFFKRSSDLTNGADGYFTFTFFFENSKELKKMEMLAQLDIDGTYGEIEFDIDYIDRNKTKVDLNLLEDSVDTKDLQ